MSDALDVYVNQDLAGQLREVRGKLLFAYAEEWLGSDRFFPLSVTMPRQLEEFPDEISRPFFENLLPEGEVRAAIAKLKRVSEKNTFGLLEEIGGDCAGAVSLWSVGEVRKTDVSYTPISEKKLGTILADMQKRPLLVADDELRLSLAGAQNKLPVYYDGEQLSLPLGGAPSSHILKPGSPHYENMPVNECFCMVLANKVGLPVPKSAILRKPGPIYLVARYDRVIGTNGKLTRIHQIDFCQALNLPSSKKYEKEGGPSLAACFDVVSKYSSQAAKDRLGLILWVIFNYLIGNADAHAKNLSLLITTKGITLAPFYDLICTGTYLDLTDKLALKIGGENRPSWLQKRHWEVLAKESGANPRIVWKQINDLSEAIIAAAEVVRAELDLQVNEQELVDKICSIISTRSKYLLGLLKK